MTALENTATIEINGAKLTVDTQALFRAWMEKNLGISQKTTSSFDLGLLNDGEHYAGILLGKDGAPNHHLILLPGEKEDIKWAAAIEWVKEIGGELPTRREQSLLFANLKEQFAERWYWSCEQHASYSDYAWTQGFDDGIQGYGHEGGVYRARAVRRLVIL